MITTWMNKKEGEKSNFMKGDLAEISLDINTVSRIQMNIFILIL